MNQELPLSTYCSMIKDGFDDILVIIHIDGRWLRSDTAGKEHRIVIVGLLQATRMDFRVDLVFCW